MSDDLLITVGEFVLNKDRKVLFTKEGEEIQLHATLFRLLLCFIENSNQVLSKQKILDSVWQNKTVSEANVNQNVRKLRDLLGDNASSPTYIETIPLEGYRFIANSADFKATPLKSQNRTIIFVALISAIVITGLTIFLFNPKPPITNKFVSISSIKGAELTPSATRDGKYIAFSIEGDDEEKIYIKKTESESYHWLKQDSKYLIFPEFSPNQKRLMLFQKDEKYCGITIQDINLNNYLLGPRLNILTCPGKNSRMRGVWVSDSMIAVSINRTLRDPANIILLNLIDSSLTAISEPNEVGFGDYNLSFSEKNRQLLYLKNVNMSATDIWLYGIDTKIHKKILTIPLLLSSIAWSKDGKGFFYRSDNNKISHYNIEKKESEIVVVSEQSVSNPFLIGESELGLIQGEYIVSDIKLLTIDGKLSETLVGSSYNDYDGVESDNHVIFVSDRSGRNQIWRKDKDSGEMKQLSNFEASYRINSIDMSKHLIAFSADSKIIVLDIEGNILFRTDEYESDIYFNNPALSSDGKLLLMTGVSSGGSKIYSSDIEEGTVPKPLFEGISAHWVDDGGYFIKSNDLSIYRFSNNFEVTLVPHIKLDNPLSENREWSVYKDTLFFKSDLDGNSAIQWIDFRTKARGQLKINETTSSFWINKRVGNVLINKATVNENRLIKTDVNL